VTLNKDPNKIQRAKLAPEEMFDMSKCVAVFIDALRKERGQVQNNAGVCVTQLAMVDRYKPLVRSLHGFESLHQIQLKSEKRIGTVNVPVICH